MGRTVRLPAAPQRIISLVPSQTELLFDLGLDEQIVGVTKFCVHPAAKVAAKQSVGGTKKFRFEVIEALAPDLIIGNKEENYQEGIERLAASFPVWVSDVQTLAEALAMMRQVGAVVNRAEAAATMAAEITAGFEALSVMERPTRIAYFIWQKPLMVAGSDTFIHDMLSRCGFQNAFAQVPRYPQVSAVEVRQAKPDMIFLSSEPFPFKEKHQQQFRREFPETAVILVDGEMFSWFGSRLLKAVPYFRQLLQTL